MGSKPRRQFRPALGVLEGRRLPSSAVIAALARPNPLPGRSALLASSLNASRARATAVASQETSGSPAPLIPGQGQPTPQELRRETFTASFTGPYSIGPGRFSDQSQVAYFRGVGGSNQFLHGDFEMGIVTPAASGTPLSGGLVMNDKSTNTGAILGLDLAADPSTLDSRNRPTSLSLSADSNIYSGIYFINTSSGTVSIRYHSYHRNGRGVATGVATVTVEGLVYTSGLTSPIRNSDLYYKH